MTPFLYMTVTRARITVIYRIVVRGCQKPPGHDPATPTERVPRPAAAHDQPSPYPGPILNSHSRLRRHPGAPAGGPWRFAPDPISDFRKKEKEKSGGKKRKISAAKSSLLLPERSCKPLSHCTTSTIASCLAVHTSALSPQARTPARS